MTGLTPDDHRDLRLAVAGAQRPRDIYVAVGEICQRRFGYILLTILLITPDGEALERVWSSREHDYPIGQRHVLERATPANVAMLQGQNFLAGDMDALRTSFPTAFAIIERLGIGFGANVPVSALGRVLGKITLSDKGDRDTATLMGGIAGLSPYLAIAFLCESRGA